MAKANRGLAPSPPSLPFDASLQQSHRFIFPQFIVCVITVVFSREQLLYRTSASAIFVMMMLMMMMAILIVGSVH